MRMARFLGGVASRPGIVPGVGKEHQDALDEPAKSFTPERDAISRGGLGEAARS
ncbi:MAG TPA: hypothetical protein VFW75_14975 [Acetobacteraceae bacterium]|nr:hypothetical protein [Acetobacteraceae bacterium]